MASMYPPKKNTAFTLYFPIRDADGDLVTGATALDSEVSIDGAAFGDCTNEATEIGSTGIYSLSLTSSEMNGDAIIVQTKTSSAGAKTAVHVMYTSARLNDDLAYPATSGRSMVVDAAGLVDANMVKAGPTGSGTAQTAGDIIGDTNDIQARLPAALTADGNMKADTLRVGGTLQTAGDLAALLNTIDDFIDTEVAAIKAKTDNLPADPADASDIAALIDALPTANENADALLDRANGIETSYTLRQAMRLILSALAAKLSGAATATVTIRDVGDSKNRIVATVDADGNRTALTLDAT